MNKKAITNFVIKKFDLRADIDVKTKTFSIADILKLSGDVNFVRRLINHLPRKKQKELIETSHLSKIERFVYNTYRNFYLKKVYEIGKGNEFKKKVTTNIILNYIRTYFVNYKITKSTLKTINIMRHKAYYDIYKNNSAKEN